jgi:squalene-hopene/tetraprenyl-beta-curcumene cyclase
MLDWLLGCQYQTVHPFTGAAPGGWGWSNLSGAVPDADDTPGALLALRHWWQLEHLPGEARERIRRSAWAGIRWLLDLQNRDKGWPTFCRGWGRYPFDRSGPDITAHVLRALVAWRPDIDDPQFGRRIDVAIAKGFAYLTAVQNEDGSWSPLWFGNQDQANEDNPVYGTAKVLMAWRDGSQSGSRPAQNGLHWFLGQQNPDGGWGGGPSRSRALSGNGLAPTDSRTSSVQETALACEVLASLSFGDGNGDDIQNAACQRGKTWLIEAVKRMEHHETWPIGFYFAKLWYYEELYPLLFATSAFRHLLAADRRSNRSNGETGGHEPSPRVTKH